MFPLFDPAGLALALMSVFFFVGAIVYIIRSQGADRLEIPLGSVLTGEGELLGDEIFSNVVVEPRYSPAGLMLSVALHLVILTGTPILSYVFPSSLVLDWQKY